MHYIARSQTGCMKETILKVGAMAPDIELPADTGEMVRLSDLRGRRVILYFYPKDNTSGCTTQACAFRDTYPDIETRNAVVVGISPDSVASHQKFKTKNGLPFLLLADEQHTAAEAYGVWGEKKMYGKTYMGVIRSHFVIDETGRLLDVQVNVKASDSARKALQSLPGGEA
jgi:peroxiredoxin Q/BCP